MLESNIDIAGIGQAVLELLSFKVGSGSHQRGISLSQKFSEKFGYFTENDVISDKSKFSKIRNWDIF